MLSENAKRIIAAGGTKARVKRSGMLQVMSFTIKYVPLGSGRFVELHTDRVIEISEVQRVADETGLPVEADTKRAFPAGKGAKDFLV